MANVANQLQSTAAAAERVFEFIDEEEEKDLDVTPETVLDPGTVEGRVSFNHVRFGYSDEETVINDFSFTAKPGQRIAIVGLREQGRQQW